MDKLVLRPRGRQAGDGHPLTSKRVPPLLDLEKQTGSGRWAGSSSGSSGSHPKAEPGQSPLGSAQNPWRTAQAWHQPLASQCGQVYGSAQETAFTDLACLPEQPHKEFSCDPIKPAPRVTRILTTVPPLRPIYQTARASRQMVTPDSERIF